MSTSIPNPIWECVICTFKNHSGHRCSICEAWQCSRCTTVNQSEAVKCISCNQQKIYNAPSRNQDPWNAGSDMGYVRKPRAADTKIVTARAILDKTEKVFDCECKTGAFCGEHMQLMIFQEYPIRGGSDYPQSVDDMRYIGSAIPSESVFSMINSPRVKLLLSKVSTQRVNGVSITVDEKYLIASITISKSRYGIEIYGPSMDVMKKLYGHVVTQNRPVCIEVSMSDSTDDTKSNLGYYASHGIILAIVPGETKNKVYLIDPNTCSRIAQYKSSDIEAVLMQMLPTDERFELIPQAKWLKGRSFNINGSYTDLGISSGWCRTISVLMAGLIMRRDNPMRPEDVLEYIAKQPRELCIMMFDATIRHVVSHLLTSRDCEKYLANREEIALKHVISITSPK